MLNRRRLPFQNLGTRGWRNLALPALIPVGVLFALIRCGALRADVDAG